MSPNDPTPDAASDEPAADGDVAEVADAAAAPTPSVGGRLPPGPDDKPISNLPPPAGATAEASDGEAEGAGSEGAVEPEDATDDAAATDAAEDEELDPEVAADLAAMPADDGEDAAEPEVDTTDDAAAADDEAEADESTEGPTAVDPSGPTDLALSPHRRRQRLVAALVLIAVVASVIAINKVNQVGDLTAQRDDRQAVEVLSARFGSAYLSFDFEHPEVSGDTVRALATKKFAASYSAQSAPGIQQLFTSRQTTTKARTTAVYLGPIRSGAARVLVVVDVTATSPSDGDQRLDDVSFVLDLDQTAAGWRVDKVARAPQPSLADDTTTTAAP